MTHEILNEVDLLPRPMIIETEPRNRPLDPVHVETGPARVEFKVLQTFGEQGTIFDTSGNMADADLIDRARRFISLHKLTGTDAESLALLAKQRPALLAQLLEPEETK
jgi:hypothetical protein